MESLYFLNVIGNGSDLVRYLEIPSQLHCGKSAGPDEFIFFLYLLAEFFEFSFNPQCKIWWLSGYLDRVFVERVINYLVK